MAGVGVVGGGGRGEQGALVRADISNLGLRAWSFRPRSLRHREPTGRQGLRARKRQNGAFLRVEYSKKRSPATCVVREPSGLVESTCSAGGGDRFNGVSGYQGAPRDSAPGRILMVGFRHVVDGVATERHARDGRFFERRNRPLLTSFVATWRQRRRRDAYPRGRSPFSILAGLPRWRTRKPAPQPNCSTAPVSAGVRVERLAVVRRTVR